MTLEEKRKKAAEYSRRYRAAHKEQVRESNRKWREANPEKAAAARKQWVERYPEKYQAAIKRSIERRRERKKKDPEYAVASSEYMKARNALRGGKRKFRAPAWLTGTVPEVPVKSTKLHIAKGDS